MSKNLLSESEGYDLLDTQGIARPACQVVKDSQDALTAAREIGYPVVLKVVSSQIVHKSDVGGVEIGIADDAALASACDRIVENVKERAPEAHIDGFIVEKQMPPGLELLIGGKTDFTFGKVITFGIGGKLVELIRDVKIKVLPLADQEIGEMVKAIRSYKLIAGYRGEPAKDESYLIEVIGKICRMFQDDDRIVEFDINPLILYEKGACAVDARIYMDDEALMISPTLAKPISGQYFYPESIAVIGASADSRKVGYAVLRNLMSFPGKLYAVNPKGGEILGHKVFTSISSIEGKVDMIVVAVPASFVPDIIREASKKGTKLAVVISAGFREIGAEGKILEEKLVEASRKTGIRLVGPNCLGIMLPHKKINATFDSVGPMPGRIAFISQSGATITTVVDWSLQEQVGFSAIISVGNQADLGFDEYLKFAADDEDTESIILYIEQIMNGREFMKAVKEVSEKKPVVAIKSGESKLGQKAASSHTGSLAGSYEVYMAAFEQSDVIAAHSLQEAFQIGELLASEGNPKGKRAVIISNAGGFAVLATDYAERYGIDIIKLPDEMMQDLNSFLTPEWSKENPMDIVGDADSTRYAKVFDIMVKHHDKWDIAFIISVPTATLVPTQLATEIVRFSKSTHKMTVGCLLGGESIKGGVSVLRSSSIPNFSELEEAFRAVGHAIDWVNMTSLR